MPFVRSKLSLALSLLRACHRLRDPFPSRPLAWLPSASSSRISHIERASHEVPAWVVGMLRRRRACISRYGIGLAAVSALPRVRGRTPRLPEKRPSVQSSRSDPPAPRSSPARMRKLPLPSIRNLGPKTGASLYPLIPWPGAELPTVGEKFRTSRQRFGAVPPSVRGRRSRPARKLRLYPLTP